MKKLLTLIAVAYTFQVYAAGPIVSIESLLNEMTDREALARYPAANYTNKQVSSYDRAMVSTDKPCWFGNWDRTQFYGVDKNNGRTEYVMMDVEGPGAVVRFWMTFAGPNCGKGTMRIYIDDMTEPVIEGKAFDIVSGGKIAGAPLSTSVSELTPYENRGHNLYFPIPYAKRCKITYESEGVREDDFGATNNTECVYYNINYRTYEPGTQVLSYSASRHAANKKLINKTQSQLRTMDRGLRGVKLSTLSLDANLAAGQSKTFVIEGSNSIRHLGMKLAAQDREQALRSIVLSISFDGEQTVWIPAGDFFGIGPRPIYTNTWYTSATPEGQMDAWWVMPFEKKCEITLTNYGNETISVDAAAQYAKWEWDSRSMHFGSAWHQYNGVWTGGPKDFTGDNPGVQDLNFVSLTGKGVYVGDGIALFNTTYHWWGEGDEKVFVDGEKFPSHVGTGTEDYYGYAWCRPETFTDHPFIAQPLGTGSFAPAYTTNTRVRSLDAIPFGNSITFDMELWHWANGMIDYSTSTFWYMLPGGKSNIEPDIESVQRKVAMKRSDLMPERTVLSLEGEAMGVASIESGYFDYRCAYPEKVSGGMQLLWGNAAKGTKLVMEFDNAFDFTGSVSAVCSMDRDYCVADLYLNGKELKKGLDLWASGLQFKKFALGEGSLLKGRNTLEIVITTIPGKAPHGRFAIDKIIFGE